jgi:FG-GAP repeat
MKPCLTKQPKITRLLGFLSVWIWLASTAAPAQIVGGGFLELYQWQGQKKDGNFGFQVAAAGDANGDGYADLIVGAPWSGLGGKAWIYSGADGSILHQLVGSSVTGQFGYSVASAGDVNLDGFDDVIVGANTANAAAGAAVGSAYVYSGLTGQQIYQWKGSTANENFGQSVCGVQDINQDGYPDLLIGAPLADPGGRTSAGSAYLYSGFDGALLRQWDGLTTYGNFGRSVSAAADVNHDGVPDLMIGAPKADPQGRADAGSVFVYSGLDASLLYQWDGRAPDDQFGSSVSSAGDSNGDDFADLIIGAPKADPGGISDAGSAYLYSGIDGALLYRLDGLNASDQLGFSVAGAGDFDRDNFDDVIIGAPHINSGGQTSGGSAYLYSGADASVLHSWQGQNSDDRFGYSVSSAGDVNANGQSDLIIGAPAINIQFPKAGSSYVYSLDPYIFTNTSAISAALGGELQIKLDFPDTAGLDFYKILISRSGIGPTHFGVDIPLTLDQVVLETYAGNYRLRLHTNMQGTLNFYGQASASLTLPPGIHPSFIGMTFFLAAISNSPGRKPEYSSAALNLTITP